MVVPKAPRTHGITGPSAALGVALLLSCCIASGCLGGGQQPVLPDTLGGATQDLTVSTTTGAVTGEIVQSDGSAVEAAVITLTHGSIEGSVAATTNALGVFAIGNLPPGAYQATVSVDDQIVSTTSVVVVAGVIRAVRIAL